jgi:rare lipoprotein A (peptidoglycan hydrolase)
MFASYFTAALMAVSAVSASVLPRTATASTHYPVPSTYTQKWLEAYDQYHSRYLALDCKHKHNTQFFDDCCHPMLKWETFEKARKPYCAPGFASSSAVPASTQIATVSSIKIASATSHVQVVNTKTSSTAAASATANPDDEDTCEEGDENCDCTEVDDDDDDEDDSEDCDADDDGDNNEDDGEECEEGEEDCVCEDIPVSSSAAHTASTVKASPTSSRSVVLITSTVTASSTQAAVTSSLKAAVVSSSKVEVTSTPVKVTSSTKAAVTSSSAPVVTPTPKTTETPSSTVHTTSKTADNVPLTSQTSGSFSSGDATFYYQGGAAGACGNYRKDSDFIAAIDYRRYGALDKKSLLCGLQAKVTNHKNGKSVTVTIEDACPTCKNQDSIDLSKAAFLQIATEAEGEVPVTVEFVGRAY